MVHHLHVKQPSSQTNLVDMELILLHYLRPVFLMMVELKNVEEVIRFSGRVKKLKNEGRLV